MVGKLLIFYRPGMRVYFSLVVKAFSYSRRNKLFISITDAAVEVGAEKIYLIEVNPKIFVSLKLPAEGITEL
jgi:hypothetical protein